MSALHRVPVIERMMDVLGQLERAEGRPTVNDLATSSGVPRSTVYRILNTLEAHRLVVRSGKGGYQLGSRLVTLAARVPHGAEWERMASLAQPWLQRLAAETGETSKLSVLDGDAALCVAVAQGSASFAAAAMLGGRYPLHAGAASKVLFAAMASEAREVVLAGRLERLTDHTMVDPAALRLHLAQVREQGWAVDVGEHSVSIQAVAAPVRGPKTGVVAAISIAHFAGHTAATRARYCDAVCRCAEAVSLASA